MAHYPGNIDLSTLDGTNGFKISGVAAGDDSGFSVASAGDVNGDGLADLIVGAVYASANGPGSGASYVVFGSRSGFGADFALSSLNGFNGFKISGAAAGDLSGYSVSSAGDINGDGFADVIIGAVGAGPFFSGAAYVLFGKASGFPGTVELSSLHGSNGFELNGTSEDSQAGTWVNSAGDVNGDGIADLIVGGGDAAAYVVFGAKSGFAAHIDLPSLNGSDGFIIDKPIGGGGPKVASAGDVNGDGIDDLIIGAPYDNPHGVGSGASYVVFGSALGFPAHLDLAVLNGSNGFKISGQEPGDHAGHSVASAGDINGDGFADLVVGAFHANAHHTYAGASYVIFGKASGFTPNLDLSSLDGTNGFKIRGAGYGNASGMSVSSAGDVNGDGFDDLIIGAPFAGATNGRDSAAGASYVVFGGASGFSADLNLASLDGTHGFKITGPAGGNWSGWSVSSAGDVNGDGLADLIVGAPTPSSHSGGAGASYVIYGRQPGAPVHLVGTDISQHLVGGGARDTLIGMGGDDHLYGNGGNDTLDGGAGDDTLDGGAGRDTASYADATSAVHVALGITGPQDTGGAGVDTLISIEKLVGSDFDDTLIGNHLDDAVFGGAGDDTLVGGGIDDKLTGGAGADTFVFGLGYIIENNRIKDFSHGTDHLAFHSSDYGLPVGALDPADLVFGTHPTDHHGEFIYDAALKTLSWDPDGIGGAATHAVVSFPTAVTLTASDFIILA